MIKIVYKNREYSIQKDKIIFVLSKLQKKKIQESEILDLMCKYKLFDEIFLENINKI